MDDKNLHIDQLLNSAFPEPGMPVNDAWKAMKLMLDDELPSAPLPPNVAATGAKLIWTIIGFALLCLIGVGSWHFLNYPFGLSDKKYTGDNSLYNSNKPVRNNELTPKPLNNKAVSALRNNELQNGTQTVGSSLNKPDKLSINKEDDANKKSTGSLVSLVPGMLNTTLPKSAPLTSSKNKKDLNATSASLTFIKNVATKNNKNASLNGHDNLKEISTSNHKNNIYGLSSISKKSASQLTQTGYENKLQQPLSYPVDNITYTNEAKPLTRQGRDSKKNKRNYLKDNIQQNNELASERFNADSLRIKLSVAEWGLLFEKNFTNNFKVENANMIT